MNDIIVLWRGDITHLEIDAIVTEADESLMGGEGGTGNSDMHDIFYHLLDSVTLIIGFSGCHHS